MAIDKGSVPIKPPAPPKPITNTTSPTPTLRNSETRAASFAKSLIGTSTAEDRNNPLGDNHRYCLGTVADAFTNAPKLHNNMSSSVGRLGSASDFTANALKAGNVSQGAPGVGDIALYSGGSNGHVAVGIGNGYVVSGDIAFGSNGQPHYSANGQYHRIPYDKLASIFGHKYEGYTEGTSQSGGRDSNAGAVFSGSPTSGSSGGVTRANTRVVPTNRVKSDAQVASGTIGGTSTVGASETRPSSTSLGSQFTHLVSGFTGAVSNFFGGNSSPTTSSSSGGVQSSNGYSSSVGKSTSSSIGAPSPMSTSSMGKPTTLESVSAGGQSPLEQPVGKI